MWIIKAENIKPEREALVKRLRAKGMKALDDVIKDQERMTIKELDERLKPVTRKIQEVIKQEIQDEERRKKEDKKRIIKPKRKRMIDKMNPKKKKGRSKKKNGEEDEDPDNRERTQKIYAWLEEARSTKLP